MAVRTYNEQELEALYRDSLEGISGDRCPNLQADLAARGWSREEGAQMLLEVALGTRHAPQTAKRVAALAREVYEKAEQRRANLRRTFREEAIRAEARDEQMKAWALTQTLDQLHAANAPARLIGWVNAERGGWHDGGADLGPWTR